MNILISVHTYYPDKNGVQAVTQYIAEGLAKNNEVTVVTENSNSKSKIEEYNNVHILRIPARTGYIGYKGKKKTYLDLITKINPDILVIVCTQSWTSDWIFKSMDKLKCKKVLYTHGYSGLTTKFNFIESLKSPKLMGASLVFQIRWHIYYSYAYKYISKFDFVTYLSQNDISVKYAEKHKLKNGYILGNAVEESFFLRPIENNEKKIDSADNLRFVCISNYITHKNQLFVLRSYYMSNVSKATLCFAGNAKTQYLEKLYIMKKQFDKEYGFKKVEFLVGLSRKEINDLLNRSDIFVTGSKWEAYPIVVAEAMAKGLSVIATDVGNLRSIPGVIIVKDELEMTCQMEYLVSNVQLRTSLGSLLRDYALINCTVQKKIRWFENKLEEINNVNTEKIKRDI